MKKKVFGPVFFVFCALVLALSIRGLPGIPDSREISSEQWKEAGPFELSPERGRFALLYSLLEDKSFQFSSELATFAEPDVALVNGKYVSLFAPGVSFLAIPGYLLGKYLGFSVVGAILSVSVFALVNTLLVYLIAIKLGADCRSAALGSLAFIFGSPAFAYGVTLYQHHPSLSCLLLSLYFLVKWKSAWVFGLCLFLLSFSVFVDYPNFLLGLPIALYALSRLWQSKKGKHSLILRINFGGFLFALPALVPIALLLWFNVRSFGNPFRLSGVLERPKESLNVETRGESKKALSFFNSRDLVNGFSVHFFSPDRGVFWYSPVVLLGVVGVISAYRKKNSYLALLIAVLMVNVLVYSLWGDPWGGWAFGSRYLIPGYAILSIFLSLALTWLNWHKIFLFAFVVLFGYSVMVNTLGALTSSKNPPRVEILALEAVTKREEKYTYERNLDYLFDHGTKSFFFRVLGHGFLTPPQFYQLLFLVIFGGSLVVIAGYLYEKSRNKN